MWEDEASQRDETPSDQSNYSDELMLETDEEDQPELPTRKQKTRPHTTAHSSTPLNSSSVPMSPTPHRDKPSVAEQSHCEESTPEQEWRPKYCKSSYRIYHIWNSVESNLYVDIYQQINLNIH